MRDFFLMEKTGGSQLLEPEGFKFCHTVLKSTVAAKSTDGIRTCNMFENLPGSSFTTSRAVFHPNKI